MDNLECVATNLYEEEFQVVKRSVHGVASTFSKEVSHQTCVGSHIVIVTITFGIIIVSIGDIYL